MEKHRKKRSVRGYVLIWNLIRLPATLLAKSKFGFKAEPAPKIKGPYLVVSNHNSGWDPVLVSCSFRRHMYYVAGEHVFRWGLLSWLIRILVAPISRVKGSTDGAAAYNTIRTLKTGSNVCLFAEGNMSFTGRTCEIHPTVGRLVKMSGATLVTYRLRGIYLSRPRWSNKRRRGKSSGECVGIYSPETLSHMSAEQIYDAIVSDLYEDAFETQRKQMIPFRGEKLAENLETALYICPGCGGRATLKSEDNRFFCSCGFETIYDEYGFFTGAPFSTVAEWNDWQEKELREICESSGELPIFSDGCQTLNMLHHDHSVETVAEGTLSIWRDLLKLGDFAAKISDISALDIHGRDNVVFSYGGKNYEICSSFLRSGRKYVDAYRILKGAHATT